MLKRVHGTKNAENLHWLRSGPTTDRRPIVHSTTALYDRGVPKCRGPDYMGLDGRGRMPRLASSQDGRSPRRERATMSTASGPNISQFSFTSGPKNRRLGARRPSGLGASWACPPRHAFLTPRSGLEFNSAPAAAATASLLNLSIYSIFVRPRLRRRKGQSRRIFSRTRMPGVGWSHTAAVVFPRRSS